MSYNNASVEEIERVLRQYSVGEYTVIPEKHIPLDRITLAILQEIALGISMIMARASSREDVLQLHDKAIKEAKATALRHGVSHLIAWDTFLLNT